MDSTKKADEHIRHSRLSRRLLGQYLLAMFGFLAALFVAIVVAWNVYQSISWQESDPVYQTLLFVRDYFPAFLTGAVLLGWTWITYRFIARPLRYLDLVTSAAEQLAHPDESPIVLPDALADTEYELNLVRERALRDA